MVPVNSMGAACSGRLDRRQCEGTGIGRDYTEGQEGLLVSRLQSQVNEPSGGLS